MATPSDDLTREIVRLKDVKNWSWNVINEHYPDIAKETLRSKYRRFIGKDGHKKKGKPTIKSEQRRNTATVESRAPRITTLEQLLAAADVDLDTWRVDRYIINKWEVGAKAEYKNLTWTSGVMDGSLRADGLTISPLFQVKAWLVRIKPVAIIPVIAPVECKAVNWPSAPPRVEGVGRSLIWSDPQFGYWRNLRDGALTPFHNAQVLDIILQIAQASYPDRMDVLGDFLDLPDWTDKFVRSPEFTECTQPAIIAGHQFLAQFRAKLPDLQIRIHEGNHDRRMNTAISKHLASAYDLRAADELDLPPALSVPRLLALHNLGIEWIANYPNDADWLNDSVRICHGEVARVAGDTAKSVATQSDVTEIFGHIHRMELVARTKHIRGKQHALLAFSPGCACWIDGRVPGRKSREQWQNGCAIVDYERDGTAYSIAPILIEDGRAMWDGKLFTSEEVQK